MHEIGVLPLHGVVRRRRLAGIDMGQAIRDGWLRIAVGLGGRLIDLGLDGTSEAPTSCGVRTLFRMT